MGENQRSLGNIHLHDFFSDEEQKDIENKKVANKIKLLQQNNQEKDNLFSALRVNQEKENDQDYDNSASALENATGWNEDKLNQDANDAENALKNGISAGNMMNKLGGLMGGL